MFAAPAAVADETQARRELLPTGALRVGIGVGSGDALFELLRQGRADAVAMGREGLETLARRLPGARVLEEHFHATGVAPAVTREKPAALAYISTFIEQAKADGTVRRILDSHGITGPIAPPAKP